MDAFQLCSHIQVKKEKKQKKERYHIQGTLFITRRKKNYKIWNPQMQWFVSFEVGKKKERVWLHSYTFVLEPRGRHGDL